MGGNPTFTVHVVGYATPHGFRQGYQVGPFGTKFQKFGRK